MPAPDDTAQPWRGSAPADLPAPAPPEGENPPDDAKRRWREGRLGNVSLLSPRGVAAAGIICLCFLTILAAPAIQLLNLVRGEEVTTNQDFTRADLVVNLGFNTIVLVVLPMIAISISRPGEPGAIPRRLRLFVRPITALHALIGAVITVGAIFGLGIILDLLQGAGIYEADESELVPQIQALLNWPLVIGISVVAGFTEETFFRGVLQPRLGLIGSNVIFALIHAGYGTVLQVVAPFFLGLLFGLLFQRTKSLWTAIVAHFTFDFVELSILLLCRDGIIPDCA